MKTLKVSFTTWSPGYSPWPCMSNADLGASLDLLQELGELLPVVHDHDAVALLPEGLLHLLHLLLAFFQLVDTDVADARDTGTHGSSGTTLAVLDSYGLFWLDAELLAGVEVNFGIWLAGRGVERGSGAVDVFVGEVLVDSSLLEGGDDTGFGRGADNGHGVAGLLQ